MSYFDGCPNWHLMHERLVEALVAVGRADVPIHLIEVTTEEQARAMGFAGSPTVHLDGVDPFTDDQPRSGLTCRLYTTPDGVTGSPSVQQLAAAVSASH